MEPGSSEALSLVFLEIDCLQYCHGENGLTHMLHLSDVEGKCLNLATSSFSIHLKLVIAALAGGVQ